MAAPIQEWAKRIVEEKGKALVQGKCAYLRMKIRSNKLQMTVV